MKPRKIVSAAATVAVCGLAGCGHGDQVSAPTSLPSVSPATASTTTTSTAVPPTTARAALRPVATAPAVHAAEAEATTSAVPCPANLADHLASTGSARQLITVESDGWETADAEVELWAKGAGACWQLVAGPWPSLIGENGFSDFHREGDGTTPTGIYGVGAVIYGNAPNPGVQETYVHLVCGDWWDEDPTSAEYNTFQQLGCGQKPSFGGGSEALWEEPATYPSFAVVDYNTDPIRPYVGSAIFFHADTGVPTTGCVSVPLADLDQALRWIDPAENPVFVMGPSSEITGF